MKRFVVAVTLFISAALLAGCGPAIRVDMGHGPVVIPPSSPTATPRPTEQPSAPEGEVSEQNLYGSVGLLTQPTVLVSVYLENSMDRWTEEEIDQSRKNLSLAMDWIGKQMQTYGRMPDFYCDDGSHDDLHLTKSWAQPFVGGEGADEGELFYEAMDAWSAQLDTAALQAAYGTDRVGFLYFVPGTGCDHTMVHYAEDEEYYYYEYCILYREDCYEDAGAFDSPTAYAHEILHLFGAMDLYEDSPDVSEELVEYVADTYPDAIMYDTYDGDDPIDYEAIHKQLCEVTAYRTGLMDHTDLGSRFPELTAAPPGVFSYTADEDGGAPEASAAPNAPDIPGGPYNTEAPNLFGGNTVAVKPSRRNGR